MSTRSFSTGRRPGEDPQFAGQLVGQLVSSSGTLQERRRRAAGQHVDLAPVTQRPASGAAGDQHMAGPARQKVGEVLGMLGVVEVEQPAASAAQLGEDQLGPCWSPSAWGAGKPVGQLGELAGDEHRLQSVEAVQVSWCSQAEAIARPFAIGHGLRIRRRLSHLLTFEDGRGGVCTTPRGMVTTFPVGVGRERMVRRCRSRAG